MVNLEPFYDLADLAQLKKYRIDQIDKRTSEIIGNGFSHNGRTFSLSQNAQINITNLIISKDMIPYPVNYNTIDNSESYPIADSTEIQQFYGAALAAKKGALDSGNTLKDQINACTTIEEVNAIVDNR